jgi:ankyrin repeat protein
MSIQISNDCDKNLRRAATSGDVQGVKELLKKGAKVTGYEIGALRNIFNEDLPNVPLDNFFSIIEILMPFYFNPSSVYKPYEVMYEILVNAVYSGNYKAVERILMSGINPNSEGRSLDAIVFACMKGNISMIALLLHANAKVNENCLEAISGGYVDIPPDNPDILNMILEQGGFEILKRNKRQFEYYLIQSKAANLEKIHETLNLIRHSMNVESI